MIQKGSVRGERETMARRRDMGKERKGNRKGEGETVERETDKG